MFEILHDLVIEAKSQEVFRVVSTPKGLNKWWTLDAEGEPSKGKLYRFYFGPEYDWTGKVSKYEPLQCIEWEMTDCDVDWSGTVVGFRLVPQKSGTLLEFYHKNWKENNAHFRTSSFCWASYLRLLKRYIEHGEFVPYEFRNSV